MQWSVVVLVLFTMLFVNVGCVIMVQLCPWLMPQAPKEWQDSRGSWKGQLEPVVLFDADGNEVKGWQLTIAEGTNVANPPGLSEMRAAILVDVEYRLWQGTVRNGGDRHAPARTGVARVYGRRMGQLHGRMVYSPNPHELKAANTALRLEIGDDAPRLPTIIVNSVHMR